MSVELDESTRTLEEVDDWQWRIVRKLAFSFDAEHMHEAAIYLLRMLSFFISKDLDKSSEARDPYLAREFMGLQFSNPIGLAAGFDVDGECIPALQALGFGFIELGGVTQFAQPGNKKPRIFRILEDKAIINRLNFYNKGAHRLRKRLQALREKDRIFVPIGINLGKSNFLPVERVPEEYLETFKCIYDVADYVTLNISCPNSVGLSRFQTTQSLGSLLDTICNFNESLPKKVPILLKLGPDLSNEEAIACAETAVDYRLSGLIISNTTTKRIGLSRSVDFGPGGLSGQPLFERSTQLLRCVARDYKDRLVLVGSGGIIDSAKMLEKFNAGANLLQVYTGFIYGGPNFIFRLLGYLRKYHLS